MESIKPNLKQYIQMESSEIAKQAAKGSNPKARVKVAIRVRPMISKQLMNSESSCIQFKSDSEIVIDGNRSYKFDRVFREDSPQADVYNFCIRDLVLSCFDGYNAAVLAYGQTGSGKTFSMGTSAATLRDDNTAGIIPRVIRQIFTQVQQRKSKADIRIKASFLEIYNEQIIDLLVEDQSKNIKNRDAITIQERDGSVNVLGVLEEHVTSADQMIHLLQRGGQQRTTASTFMNEASSRSHAIFTIFIEQTLIQQQSNKDQSEGFMTAKFFFVDLAGSQRAKKTGATGAILRQGININLGLLQLGNVISALATIDKKHDQFITFRNSKLTRMLQDCLGGNSNTYMIACISPAESNVEESLNTLKYASKAMNIKNTPIVNRDPQSALIAQLRQRIAQLQSENRKCKQILNSKGVTIEETNLDNSDELANQLKKYKEQNRNLLKKLTDSNTEMQTEKHRVNQLQIKMYEIRRQKDLMQLSFQQLARQHPQLMNSEQSRALREGFACNEREKISVLEQHLNHIQQLEMRLVDRDKLFTQLQLQYSSLLQNSKKDEQILIKKNNLLYTIGRQNARLRNELNKASQNQTEKLLPLQLHNTTQEIEDTIIMESEVCEQDQQIQQHEFNYVKREQEVKMQLDQMDQYILERETFLQKMSREQIGMETELISSMKHQYDDKIIQLERERRNLLKQKDESSVVQKNKFVNKIQNLQNELKDYRKKAKQQKNMQKLVENQTHKIKDLAEEIKKFKMQKMELFRKLKEDKDNFDKLKSKRVKELLMAKKDNLKKDSQIRKLTLDNYKKQLINRKKDEQIKKIKRVNDTLKSILRPTTKKDIRDSLKQSNKDNLRESATSTSFVHSHTVLSTNDYKVEKQQEQYLSHIIKVILLEIDRQQTLTKYQNKLQESEKELQLLLNDDSIFRLKLERLRLRDDQLTEEQQTLRQQLQMNVTDLKQRIDLCEEGITICKSKYSNIFNQQIDSFDIDAHVVYNRQYEDTEKTKALLRVTFASLKNLLFENHNLMDRQEQNKMETSMLKQQVADLRQQLIDLNGQYHRNLVQMKEQMLASREQNSIEQVQAIGKDSPSKRAEQRERRDLQKKIQQLSKANRQLTSQLQKTRRKCEVVQEKYQSIKNMVSKDKNIGRQDESFRMDKRTSIPNLNTSNAINSNSNKAVLEQLDGMLQNIDRLKKTKSVVNINLDQSQIQKDFPLQKSVIEDYNNNRWDCVGKIDAHGSSVLSIAAHSNFLISTATKSLKIWDLQSRKIISQLSGPNLAGSVKFVTVDPQRRLFFTACDKTVTIWDLITLEVQGTMKCHKDEVRAIHTHGNYLFTGGKGTANGGSLLVWDFRKLNPNQPLQEKQKNQDIFTMTSRENILFYGTRNHSVRRMNINSMDILSPFEPPHLDSVTGLAVIGNKLISGSKDKNLRLWSLDHSVNNARFTLHLFNDYVNTVTSHTGHAMIYAGSKDGKVKVCYPRNQRIEVFGGILAHTQSVNSLCSLDDNPYSLVTASQDRTIKIWQPSKETTENLVKQDFF